MVCAQYEVILEPCDACAINRSRRNQKKPRTESTSSTATSELKRPRLGIYKSPNIQRDCSTSRESGCSIIFAMAGLIRFSTLKVLVLFISIMTAPLYARQLRSTPNPRIDPYCPGYATAVEGAEGVKGYREEVEITFKELCIRRFRSGRYTLQVDCSCRNDGVMQCKHGDGSQLWMAELCARVCDCPLPPGVRNHEKHVQLLETKNMAGSRGTDLRRLLEGSGGD